NRAVGMTVEIGPGVDVVVAQGAGLLGRLEFCSEGEDRLVPAHDLHDLFQRVTLAGTGIADLHPLALEIVEALDIGIAAREYGEDLTLQGENGAQIIHRPFFLERRQTFHRLVLMVGLHHAEVELAAAQTVDVGHAAATGRSIALDVLGVAVDEAADRLPRHVINARLTTGTDGYEPFLRLRHTTQTGSRQCSGKDPCQGFALHGCTPFGCFLDTRAPFECARVLESSRPNTGKRTPFMSSQSIRGADAMHGCGTVARLHSTNTRGKMPSVSVRAKAAFPVRTQRA